MKFPNKKYKSVKEYKKDYYSFLKVSFDSINDDKLSKVIQILDRAYRNPKRKILVCGNGGSAALANHFACDHQKILNETKKLKPFLISLSSHLFTLFMKSSYWGFVQYPNVGSVKARVYQDLSNKTNFPSSGNSFSHR